MTRSFTYGSVCSGVEAASLAFKPLGWRPAFFAEIDPHPCHVLHHHFSSCRPRAMPDPDEKGISSKERKIRRNAITNVRDIPEITNGIPNAGDFRTIEKGHYEPIDLLVGGTPCQDFSLAGLRAGLGGDRGNLSLEFCRLAQRLASTWVLWENVPGVLSQNNGRDFAAILRGLGECGYGLAYRVLDVQYCRVDRFPRALPQRRRRVFVVGYLGDWRRAAAVLFERASMLGDSAPRRQTGERIAPTISARAQGGGGLGIDFDCDGGLVAKAVKAGEQGHRHDPSTDNYIPEIVGQAISSKWSKGSSGPSGDEHHNLVAEAVAGTLTSGKNETGGDRYPSCDVDSAVTGYLVAHSLRGDGHDASEDGSGRGTPIIPVDLTNVALGEDVSGTLDSNNRGPHGHGVIAFGCKDYGQDATVEVAPTLRAMNEIEAHPGGGGQLAIAFDETQITSRDNRSNPMLGDPSHTLASIARPPTVAIAFDSRQSDVCVFGDKAAPLDTDGQSQAVALSGGGGVPINSIWRVRRLMPIECERLMGFPPSRESAIINVWCSSDLRSNDANAEDKNRKSRVSALDVAEGVSGENANHAVDGFYISHQDRVLPAVLSVFIDLELMAVEISKAGKLLWPANGADGKGSLHLLARKDDFARLLAVIVQTVVLRTRGGKAASHQSVEHSTREGVGKNYVNVFGPEITALVGDVEKFTEHAKSFIKSITSEIGVGSRPSDIQLQTWCCFAIAAISSFIPKQTFMTSSFAVEITVSSGWTKVPFRGKPMADGPRYKMIGNSQGVNVMTWLGERIEMVRKIP